MEEEDAETEADDVLGPGSLALLVVYDPGAGPGPVNTVDTLPGEGSDDAVEGEGNPRLEQVDAGEVSSNV